MKYLLHHLVSNLLIHSQILLLVISLMLILIFFYFSYHVNSALYWLGIKFFSMFKPQITILPELMSLKHKGSPYTANTLTE